MSLRLQLLQVARLAPRLLADSADLVRAFYARQFNEQGAASDRGGKPDLYYTIFALAGAQALDVPVPIEQTREWLKTFREGGQLDFVHLGALALCWAVVGGASPDLVSAVLAVIDRIAEMVDAIGAGEDLPEGDDAPLIAALAESAGNQDSVNTLQMSRRILTFKDFRLDPVEVHPHLIGNATVN